MVGSKNPWIRGEREESLWADEGCYCWLRLMLCMSPPTKGKILHVSTVFVHPPRLLYLPIWNVAEVVRLRTWNRKTNSFQERFSSQAPNILIWSFETSLILYLTLAIPISHTKPPFPPFWMMKTYCACHVSGLSKLFKWCKMFPEMEWEVVQGGSDGSVMSFWISLFELPRGWVQARGVCLLRNWFIEIQTIPISQNSFVGTETEI
jgi:hypothetical protein